MEDKYKYKAVNQTGDIIQGSINAISQVEAMNALRSKGLKPIKISREEEKSKDVTTLSSPKLSLKDLILFCRQVSTMLNSGMALNKSLDVFLEQSKSKKVKSIMKEVSTYVQKGETLSNAMKSQNQSFPQLLIVTVEAGELTGKLGDVLERMAVFYEKEKRIRGKIKSAMMYPIVLSVISTISVSILLIFVMPGFISIFEKSGVPFPPLTMFVVNLSKFLTKYWLFVGIGIVAIVVTVKRILKLPEVKFSIDRSKLEAKLIKGPMRNIATARFTRTLATMLSSGISLIPALSSAGRNTENDYLYGRIQEVVLGIEKGMGMTEQLKKVEVFPSMMLSMIGIGEESGNLTDMLEKTADYYDEELEVAVQQMISMVEPLMIILMAIIIGTIVVAMYLPMFEIFNALNK